MRKIWGKNAYYPRGFFELTVLFLVKMTQLINLTTHKTAQYKEPIFVAHDSATQTTITNIHITGLMPSGFCP
eukprot:2288525-Amphidinium_carterae.1